MKRILSISDIEIDPKSLRLDYENFVKNLLEDVVTHNNQVLVQKKFHIVRKKEYNDIVNSIPYTKNIIETMLEKYQMNDVTYRIVMPNTAYNWHFDTGMYCYHIPLISNPGCHFVYENESYKMEVGKIYRVHNGVFHTFVNAGPKPRLHMTFENL